MNLDLALQQRAKVEEFQRKHRIGLLTLLFTDMVGSTQLKQELGDREAVALIQRHHALVREILGRFTEGEEIGTAGDSFFLVFAKPSDAVQFSLLLQARLRSLSQKEGRPMLDRIGVHIGEVVIEERPGLPKARDLYGLQVDICARVMLLAEGDQILMTRSAFDNARQILKGQQIEGIQELLWLNHGLIVCQAHTGGVPLRLSGGFFGPDGVVVPTESVLHILLGVESSERESIHPNPRDGSQRGALLGPRDGSGARLYGVFSRAVAAIGRGSAERCKVTPSG